MTAGDVINDKRDALFETAGLQKDLGRKAGRGSAIVLGFAALRFALQIIGTFILARLVSPAEHGLIALVMPAIAIILTLSEFGLADALVQLEKVTHRTASALLWMNVFLGLSLVIIVAVFAEGVAHFYNEPRVYALLLAILPTVVFASICGQYIAIFRRKMWIRKLELIQFAAAVAALSTAILFASLGYSYWALALQIVLQPVYSLVPLVFLSGWLPSRPSLQAIREARRPLKFGGLLAISRVATQMTQNAVLVLVGRFFSVTDAGIYYRAWNLANLPPQKTVSPLAGVFLPALSRAASDAQVFREFFVRATVRLGVMTTAIGVIICSSGDLLVTILLGPEWAQGGPLVSWFGVLSLQAGIMFPCHWALVAMGRAKAIFYYRLFIAVITIVVLFIGATWPLADLVGLYMSSILVVHLPVLAMLVVRYTPVSVGELLQCFTLHTVISLVSIPALLMLRTRWETALPIYELGIVIGCVSFVFGLRVLIHGEMRRECLGIYRTCLTMITRKRED